MLSRRCLGAIAHAPSCPRAPFNANFEFQFSGLSSLITDGRVSQDSLEMQKHNQDFTRLYQGSSKILIQPNSVSEISKTLKFCHDNKIAVNPQGGNTGLVGGSVPVYDEVVLSTSRMNKILDFDASSGIITCEAGVVLEDMDNFLRQHGYIAPYDLGAKGSCQVGGNVATNAGGLRLVRYGPIAGSLLGVEAVLPNSQGQVLDMLSKLRKDNTGLKLHQMFVGSEGSLGVISKVCFICPPLPSSIKVGLLKCDSFEAVVHLAKIIRRELSDIISAIEFFDEDSLDCVVQSGIVKAKPFHHAHQDEKHFYLLVETHGQDDEHDFERLSSAIQQCCEEKSSSSKQMNASDAIVVDQESKMKEIWSMRESIAAVMVKSGRCLKYDLTLPVDKMYPLVEIINQEICAHGYEKEYQERQVFAVGYGHLGDANVHINVLSKLNNQQEDERIENIVENVVWKKTVEFKGSISAEHGVGVQKKDKLKIQKAESTIQVMRDIKSVFDPHGIMNPYKVF